MDSKEPTFKQEIQQMMYIAGETLEPSVQTIYLIESIVRDQVAHLLATASDLANRRGSRAIGNDDLIFQIRHNSARVARLRSFIMWKTARKSFKDSEDGPNDGAEEVDVEEISEEAQAEKPKMPTVTLPWELNSFFSQQPAIVDQEQDFDAEAHDLALERLRQNDDRTRDMTGAEYAIFSEYRHASFTWRKAKRFREWSGLGTIAIHRSNEDVMEILGFLTSEMVQNLTAAALHHQKQELGLAVSAKTQTVSDQPAPVGLFAMPVGSRAPIEARHVREAFRRMQRPPNKRRAMLNGTRLLQKPAVILL